MRRPTRLLAAAAVVFGVALPLVGVLGSVRTSGNVIVTATDVVREDLYSFGGRTIIEGRVEGDVFLVSGELIVTGEVTGDITGLVSGPARITGTVGGSVRLAAIRMDLDGVIGDDVAALAFDARIGADVGRDALVIAGRFDVDGRTGRDVRTQAWSLDISGEVVRDVVARVSDLTVEPNASVGGDLVFRASGDIDIEDDTVGGFVAGQEVISPVWAKAVARAVAWLSLLGFVVGGAALLWMFRRTGERAVALTAERPGRSALVGALLVVAGPILVMPLSLSLVGLPIALLILVLWLVALVLGPAPAVAQVGSKILAGRGGVVGGLVIGAMVWRGAIWLLSLVGALIYLAALFIGLGSFAIAGWEARRDAGDDWRPLPPEVAAA